MGNTKEELQKDLDERAGFRSGDLEQITESPKPIAKKDMNKQADILKEALDHYYMVDAWVWRGLTDEGKKTALPHHRE